MEKKAILALAGGAYALTQMGGAAGSGKQKQGQKPPLGMGGGGLGILPGAAAGSTPGPNVTFEAPNVEAAEQSGPQGARYVPVNTSNTGTGGSKQTSSGKDKKSVDNNIQEVAENNAINSSSPDLPSVEESRDSGVNAADSIGVQSTEPDAVTRELNAQTGTKDRTETFREMKDDPEHQGPNSPFSGSGGGQKSKPQTKDKKGGGGGGIFSGVQDTVDDAADAGQDFVDDTLGWGDI